VPDDPFFDHVSDPSRFCAAIARFDELNSADPRRQTVAGRSVPRELLDSRRLCDWVLRLAPQASEALRLAARSQHLCRWQIPRDTFPQTRAGYHQWKNELKRFHAAKSAGVLRDVGYPEEMICRVSDLNLKSHFPADPETRVLEDALCLVFLEFHFDPLAAKLDDEKTINALRRSWEKMSDAGRQAALSLNFSERGRALVARALG
jgi:hypothetical protein